jgi:hypothetical protein
MLKYLIYVFLLIGLLMILYIIKMDLSEALRILILIGASLDSLMISLNFNGKIKINPKINKLSSLLKKNKP